MGLLPSTVAPVRTQKSKLGTEESYALVIVRMTRGRFRESAVEDNDLRREWRWASNQAGDTQCNPSYQPAIILIFPFHSSERERACGNWIYGE